MGVKDETREVAGETGQAEDRTKGPGDDNPGAGDKTKGMGDNPKVRKVKPGRLRMKTGQLAIRSEGQKTRPMKLRMSQEELRLGHGKREMMLRKREMKPRELAKECDRILQTKKFRDYPGAKNGLQVSHARPVKKIGWAVDADLESIRRAGREQVDFLVVHHGIFWGNSALDRKMRSKRIREAKRLGVAIYSSHLPLDAHPEIGNSTGLLRALGLAKTKHRPFGKAMGRAIGWKMEGGTWTRSILVKRCRGLAGGKVEGGRWKGNKSVKVIAAGPAICRKIGVVTGGFGDLNQVVRAGLDTLITGEADYPTEVKARELGINLILGGHRETEVFGAQRLAERSRNYLVSAGCPPAL